MPASKDAEGGCSGDRPGKATSEERIRGVTVDWAGLRHELMPLALVCGVAIGSWVAAAFILRVFREGTPDEGIPEGVASCGIALIVTGLFLFALWVFPRGRPWLLRLRKSLSVDSVSEGNEADNHKSATQRPGAMPAPSGMRLSLCRRVGSVDPTYMLTERS